MLGCVCVRGCSVLGVCEGVLRAGGVRGAKC